MALDESEQWRVDALLAVVVVVVIRTATAGDVPPSAAGAGCRAKNGIWLRM